MRVALAQRSALSPHSSAQRLVWFGSGLRIDTGSSRCRPPPLLLLRTSHQPHPGFHEPPGTHEASPHPPLGTTRPNASSTQPSRPTRCAPSVQILHPSASIIRQRRTLSSTFEIAALMLLSRQRKGFELLSTGRIIPLRSSHERVLVPTPRLAPSLRTFHVSSPAMFALTPWRGAPGTQPKTFSQQRNMPRLPVPSLEQTFDKYLKSLSPFLRQLEEQGKLEGSTAEKELAKRKQWISEFLATGGLGPKLQQRLIDVDRTTENNWLDDRWWLQKAYHEWRVPLMVNSNWWLMFTHDKNMPADLAEHSGHDAYPVTGLGSQNWNDAAWGIRRAAWLTSRFLQFKKRLDDEDIMPDSSRAGPFCMHQYTRLYGVTRIPALPHDWNTATPHPAVARHITVIARDNYYELEVVRKDGTLLGIDALEKALWDIVADAQKGDGAGVGVLSSDNRDTWTKTREHLLSVSPVNRKSINSVEDSLLCLSLDSSVLALSADHPAPAHESTPVWVDALARNCSGAGRGGHNRWFDKALSIVVEPNGRAGIMGEHSPCDALIPSILCDYAAAESCPPPGTNVPAELSSPSESAAWSKLEWAVDESTQKSIQQSEAAALQAAKESDIRTLWYDEYGADWIKKVGKHSPDAYLQMALQLAYAKAHGQQVSTYETASTRLFKHGRTDVIRSFSDEAYEFVRGVREGKDAKTLYALLTAATKSHNTQTRESSTGKGIDRHMTGLRLLLRAEDGETPAVFSDPLFAESQSWRLSTSGLSAGDRFAGTGFGTGYPTESYGINYLAGAQLLKFGIESKHNATTNFARCLVEALRDMRRICEHGGPPPEATQTPKL